MEFWLFITVIIGVFATAFPAYFCVYFWRLNTTRISRVIAYMLGGEAISMMAALWFSYHTWQQEYGNLSLVEMTALRWIIYATGLFSTIKLVLYIIAKQKQLDFLEEQ